MSSLADSSLIREALLERQEYATRNVQQEPDPRKVAVKKRIQAKYDAIEDARLNSTVDDCFTYVPKDKK